MYGYGWCKGYWEDCNDIYIETDSIIYIDPPYNKTTRYGFEFDYMNFIEKHKNTNIILLSEGKQISDNAILLSKGRSKGGISGEKKKEHNEEWLNIFI